MFWLSRETNVCFKHFFPLLLFQKRYFTSEHIGALNVFDSGSEHNSIFEEKNAGRANMSDVISNKDTTTWDKKLTFLTFKCKTFHFDIVTYCRRSNFSLHFLSCYSTYDPNCLLF